MAILRDVRSLFRRRSRPVEIEFEGTEPPSDTERRLLLTNAHDRPDASIETKPLRRRRGAEATPAYEEVMGLVRQIGSHLEHQRDRTERILSFTDRLPAALEALPEINRQNAKLVEALHEHLGQARRREEALNGTLERITDLSGRQTDVLGLVQQQLEASGSSTGRLTASVATLHDALRSLAESNVRSSDVLARLNESAAERERALAGAITRTHRWMIAAVIFCGLASAAAAVLGALALAD